MHSPSITYELRPRQTAPIPWGWTNRGTWVEKPRGEIVMPRLIDYFDWSSWELTPIAELDASHNGRPAFVTTSMKSVLTTATRFLGAEEAYVRLLQGTLDLESIYKSMFEWNMYTLHYMSGKLDMLILGDEIAGNNGMIISPDLYQGRVLAYHYQFAQLADCYNVRTGFHSDGDFSAVVEDIEDAGFDVMFYEPVGKMPKIAQEHWSVVKR